MASLWDLLASKAPVIQTRQALIVIGLQNEFLSQEGNLPIPTRSGFVDRIKELVPTFRELAGEIIWVRTEFETERLVNDPRGKGDLVIVDTDFKSRTSVDSSASQVAAEMTDIPEDTPSEDAPSEASPTVKKRSKPREAAMKLLRKISRKNLAADFAAAQAEPASPLPLASPGTHSALSPMPLELPMSPQPPDEEELFLTYPHGIEPYCRKGSHAAEFADRIKSDIDHSTDTILRTSHYSAFNETPLLAILRGKLITELFICGCISNVSVYATAVDAARHGLSINIVEDCLGYRVQSRHDAALRGMTEELWAMLANSEDLLEQLRALPEDEAEQKRQVDDLEEALMSLEISSKASLAVDGGQTGDPNEVAAALNKVMVHEEDLRPAVSPDPDDSLQLEPFLERRLRQHKSQPDMARGYVKTKVRMRPRGSDAGSAEAPRPRTAKSGASVQGALAGSGNVGFDSKRSEKMATEDTPDVDMT